MSTNFPQISTTRLYLLTKYYIATSYLGVVKLERPQEIVDLLEVGSGSEYLVDNVLHTNNIQFPKGILNDGVAGQGGTLVTVDFSVSPLVD